MKDIFKGWKELDEVDIPPIKKYGFKEDIIIRKPVEPMIEEEKYPMTKPSNSDDPETEVMFNVR